MDNLKGRRVLITNVGIGPGPAIVAELTRSGARAAIQHAYDGKVAYETTTKISSLTGSEPAIVQADLRHVYECDRAVEEAVLR
jgi:NAD(P)-dependent dehydrogenase (short-subunit alcohol dehydrogenase family)